MERMNASPVGLRAVPMFVAMPVRPAASDSSLLASAFIS